MIDGLPALVWVANMAGLEMHVPQWTVGPRGGVREPDRLVFDVDPGAPATIAECAGVAEAVREVLAEDRIECLAKTSGSKGMQVYASVQVPDAVRTSEYAREVAERLAAERPREVVSQMAKAVRGGKVLIDWSQNNPAKTTVAPYSLRGLQRPTVSTPVTWDEVARCRGIGDLEFTPEDVLERVAAAGDLLAPLLGAGRRLPPRRGR